MKQFIRYLFLKYYNLLKKFLKILNFYTKNMVKYFFVK